MSTNASKRSALTALYAQMLSQVKDAGCKAEAEHTAAMYLAGEHYFEQPQDQKLLVIGRALNGWSLPCALAPSKIEDPAALAERFVAEWDKMDDPTADVEWKERNLPHSACHHLHWVNTAIRGRKTASNGFWRLTSAAQPFLHEEGELQVERIAWTNLYKLSPAEGGNPSGRCKRAQEDVCAEILKKEIELLDPSHIVVIALTNKRDGTRTAEWVEPFAHVLQDAEKRGKTVLYFSRPEYQPSETAHTPYRYEDGKLIKIT